MLGGLSVLHNEDIKGSSIFLRQLFKNKPPLGKKRALDCGAGIGRVSKFLLCEEFEIVDLLEQDEKFCEKAKENLSSTGKLGEIFNVGLQDFKECQHTYDLIWCQWFLGSLSKKLIKSNLYKKNIFRPSSR
jgi:protein N-terminal methyltransferase